MARTDIQGPTRPPQALDTWLRRKGGLTPTSEPVFRLVWAPHRMIQKGGLFNDWDASVAAKDRGGLVRLHSGLLVPNAHRPIRSVVEMRWVVKYPGLGDGWVLERWMPPHFYGNRGDWEDRTVPGTSIPLQGPFPTSGDYEMCGFLGAGIPTVAQLADKIDRCEYARQLHKGSTEQMVRDREQRFRDEYEAQVEKDRQETQAFMRDFLRPLWGTSLNAGLIRNALAKKQGIKEHVGN